MQLPFGKKKEFERVVPNGAIVITGASTGIGATAALHFAKLGYQVFAGVRKEADGESLRQQAGDHATNLHTLLVDVTNEEQVKAAAAQVAAQVGESGIVGLVNNAGIGVFGPLEFVAPKDLQRQFDVNVTGQITVTQNFLPLLRKGHGRIVTTGSIAGKFANPFTGPYAASKHALEALSDSLRVELKPWNIHVALLEPGSIKTEIWTKAETDVEEYLKNLPPEGHTLYGKMMGAVRKLTQSVARSGIAPENVAQVIDHALTSKSPKTRYLVGQDARMMRGLRMLPDPVRDNILYSTLNKIAAKPAK